MLSLRRPYHASLFADDASLRTLARIEELELPNELRELGERLLVALAELLPLVGQLLHAMAAAAGAQRIKAMRAAAAAKTLTSVELARRVIEPLRQTHPAPVTELKVELAQIASTLAPHVPDPRATGADSDDDYY